MKTFNAVCFWILMDHHGQGIEQAHPSYIEEKLKIFQSCSEETAYSLLDGQNQSRVMEWCSLWSFPIPESIKEHAI